MVPAHCSSLLGGIGTNSTLSLPRLRPRPRDRTFEALSQIVLHFWHRMFKIPPGEPTFRFNNLQDCRPVFVRILYRLVHAVRPNSLTLLQMRAEHGFEVWNQERAMQRDPDIADRAV
jgi:hypothetical protein